MKVSLADQLNTKPVCDNRDFQAAVMTGELGEVHKEFYGPTPNDLYWEKLSVICRELKVNEVSARRAANPKRGTLKATRVEGVWWTCRLNVKEWRDNFPGNEGRKRK